MGSLVSKYTVGIVFKIVLLKYLNAKDVLQSVTSISITFSHYYYNTLNMYVQ